MSSIGLHPICQSCLVFFVFLPCLTLAVADEKQERIATKNIIQLGTKDEPEQLKEAQNYFRSIPKESSVKANAAQALALIQIQQGQWMEAGKTLESYKPDGNASNSIKLGHEKLLLWVLLESSSAESQFNRLVAIATNKNLPEPERRDAYAFLGGVLGMLESGKETLGIQPTSVVEKHSKLTSTESKAANDLFEQAWKDAHDWGRRLDSRWSEFKNLGPEGSAVILKGDQEKLDVADKALSQIKLDHKSKDEETDALENEIKTLNRNQRNTQTELNALLNSRPKQPVQPRLARPRLPRTVFNNKGEVDVAATNRAKNDYDRELREYNRKETQYQRDVQEYDAKLADWNQKLVVLRPQLEARIQQLAMEISAKEPVRKSLQEEAKKLAREELSGRKELDEAKRGLQISTIAMEQLKEGSSAPRPLLRPSHFNLLDFGTEMGRLEKSLRTQ